MLAEVRWEGSGSSALIAPRRPCRIATCGTVLSTNLRNSRRCSFSDSSASENFTRTPNDGRAAARDSADDDAFHPDLAACHPQPDLQGFARGHGAGGFDQAASAAHIRQIAPDRLFHTLNVNFHRHIAFDPVKTAAIRCQLRSEQVRLERGRFIDRFGMLKHGGWRGHRGNGLHWSCFAGACRAL